MKRDSKDVWQLSSAHKRVGWVYGHELDTAATSPDHDSSDSGSKLRHPVQDGRTTIEEEEKWCPSLCMSVIYIYIYQISKQITVLSKIPFCVTSEGSKKDERLTFFVLNSLKK